MLMRLQEAAGTYSGGNNGSSPSNTHTNNDSDSLDSHNSIQDFSTSSGVESRLWTSNGKHAKTENRMNVHFSVS